MNHTKIDWCDATWNPVTGCQHDCEYCYARRMAQRFGRRDFDKEKQPVGTQCVIGPQILEKPMFIRRRNGVKAAPYPWFFLPTFHKYLLQILVREKKPRTYFVGSMTDLFGDWMPTGWKQMGVDFIQEFPWA